MNAGTNATSRRQRLVAEYAVLSLHDQIRRQGRYDYGAGQRAAELRRRRLLLVERGVAELVNLPTSELLRELDADELLAAFERIAVPRMRRVYSSGRGAWYTTLRRLVDVAGVDVLPDRTKLELENGSPVDVDTALEVWGDRHGVR